MESPCSFMSLAATLAAPTAQSPTHAPKTATVTGVITPCLEAGTIDCLVSSSGRAPASHDSSDGLDGAGVGE